MNTSKQYPKLMMVIRHGEKPGDPGDDDHGGPDLSMLGSARAAALPSLFTPDAQAKPESGLGQLTCDLAVGLPGQFTGGYGSPNVPAGPSRFPTPDFLFASQPSKNSNRPVETITPLMQALRCSHNPEITINSNYPNSDDGIAGLKHELFHTPIYAGKVVLICWHHGKIPELVEALDVPASQLPWSKWPATIFDLILCITWNNGQANLVIDTQELLHNDVDCYPDFASGSVTLVLDAPPTLPALDDGALPKNFRSIIDRKVAGNLISGSAQFSPAQLQNMISQGRVQTPLTVVDLRQESHGFITLQNPSNDPSEAAVSWFVERDWINIAKGFVGIKADEVQKLREAANSQGLSVYSIEDKTDEDGICTSAKFSVSPAGSYNTEETLLQALDIGYLRLTTTDHCRPRDSEVDRFVAFEASLRAGTWLHFHCRAGDGRTTTFMAMHDIIHNVPGDPLDVILKRQGPVEQGGIGGVDLTKVNKSYNRYDYPFLAERVEFMQNFYNYVCQAKPDRFKLTWSEWVIQNATQA